MREDEEIGAVPQAPGEGRLPFTIPLKGRLRGIPLLPALHHTPITCPPGRVARPQTGCLAGDKAPCTPLGLHSTWGLTDD